MAIHDLNNPEMIALTRTWVDPAHEDHRILAGHPVLAALLPDIIGIHQRLLRTEPSLPTRLRLTAVRGEQGVTDDRHDGLMKVIHGRLRVAILEAGIDGDDDLAARLIALERLILPNGLRMVNATFREEVGHAMQVASKLTAEHEQLLDRLGMFNRRTLLDVVRDWLAAADHLGRLDHERRGLEIQLAGLGRRESVKVRLRWVRMIELIRRTVELTGQSPALAHLLAGIRKAEDDAARRIAARRDRAGDGRANRETDDQAPGESAEAAAGDRTGDSGETAPEAGNGSPRGAASDDVTAPVHGGSGYGVMAGAGESLVRSGEGNFFRGGASGGS